MPGAGAISHPASEVSRDGKREREREKKGEMSCIRLLLEGTGAQS